MGPPGSTSVEPANEPKVEDVNSEEASLIVKRKIGLNLKSLMGGNNNRTNEYNEIPSKSAN